MRQQSGANILVELRAREAFMRRRYDQALAFAREAADLAAAREDNAAWWQMTFLRAESFREQGRYQECRVVAEELREHPLTSASPELTARVLTMLSVVSQISGELPQAIDLAGEALRSNGLGEQPFGLQVEARLALVAALAENDQLDEAWTECLALTGMLDGEADSQIAGKAYWVVGNVAFMRRHAAEGVKYHRLAAEHLSPTNDLALWAWFNRASAAMRLAAGLVDEETYECIQRAELATSIVGGNGEDRLIVEFTKGHWHFLNGDLQTATDILSGVCEQGTNLPSNLTGETTLLLGRALGELGDVDRGVEYLRQSEEYFRQAGALDRAAHAAALISEVQPSH
ncbi:hypothetical protein HGG74_01910 [Arthrobacter sp. E918]|uniref:Tetratricopeptide repeat-containing protein n=1 Tax=Arthrobacter mobilis TaxID=2724944 RepID=A0A7X6HA80_9MICC|nr:hypothetical protein [Arthrobacter mobilis]